MSRSQFWINTVLAVSSLLLLGCNVWLVSGNRSLQQQIGARQQFVQQSVQLEGLYRDIVRSLAELAARNGDAEVRTMLGRHGITYTVNAPVEASAPGPTPPKARK